MLHNACKVSKCVNWQRKREIYCSTNKNNVS
jgi:hypothetical protein